MVERLCQFKRCALHIFSLARCFAWKQTPGGDEPDQEQILDKNRIQIDPRKTARIQIGPTELHLFFSGHFSKCGLGSDLFKITDPDPNTTAGSGFAALSVMRPTHLANSEPCNFSSSAQSL